MADMFGGISLPVAAGNDPVSDPAIGYIAAYLKAVMNAYGQAAWTEVSNLQPVVREVFTHDPERHNFNTRNCPALFVWREEVPVERIACDVLAARAKVQLLWLMEPATQGKTSSRKPFIHAVTAIMASALEQGRDPAWIDDDDTDPNKDTRGSLLPTLAGLSRIFPPTFSATGFEIELFEGNGKPLPYDGVLGELEIEELRERDPAVYVGSAPSQISISVTTKTDQDTDLTLVEYQDPPETP